MAVKRLQDRHGTAAAWTAANPVLLVAEVGYETDTGKRKTGNGSSAWNALAYDQGGGSTGLATTENPGVIRLGGDIAGPATAPTVPGLTAAAAAATAAATAAAAASTAAAAAQTKADAALAPTGQSGDAGKTFDAQTGAVISVVTGADLGDPATAAGAALTAAVAANPSIVGKAKNEVPTDVAPRTGGNFGASRSAYIPSGWVPRRLRAKLAAVQAGVAGARCKIALQGHSEIAGLGSSVGATSPGVLLRKMLAARGYPVGTGWVPMYCNIGSGATKDLRWSYTFGAGGWDYSGGAAGSSNMHFHLRSLVSGKTAVFTSDTPGSVVEIVTFGNSASFTYSVDGASPVTVTPNGSSAIQVITVTGLTNDTHTVVITTTGTTATYILAVAVRPTIAVDISAFGLSGSRASDHLPGQLFYNPYAVVDTYAPDCVVVQLDANEALNGVSVSTFATNLAAIVNGHIAAGRDVIIVNSIGPNAVSSGTWTTFRAAIYNLADTAGVPVIDLTHRLGGYSVANANGLMYDVTHPNGAGYADSVQAFLALLLDGAVNNVGSAAAVAAATPYALDTFTRADGAGAGSTEVGGYTWGVTGTGASLSIASNRLVNTGASANESDAYVDDGQADGTLQATLTSMATSNGLIFRASGTTDGYILWRNGSTGVYKISQRTGVSTYTDIATVPSLVGVAGDVVKVVLNGSSVKCFVNGAQVASFTDSTNAAKTRHGLWRANVAAAVSYDSFSHTTAIS
jgi:hypothetical protein